MEAAGADSKWFRATIAIAVVAVSATTAISVFVFRKKSRDWKLKVVELEKSLKFSLEKCVAERKGRIRAQQAIRDALTKDSSVKSKRISYPMTPIAFVESCFCTRNGTPRQPLLVPLARACLVFDSTQVHPSALDGLAEYSHCWILFVFHLNTDLEKLWKQADSKCKAKVRVPSLKGGKMGVFATRSPHRPCPIGLTLAKVEAVKGNIVLLSGVDLVDGTPVLDIKPYLPYCDSIQQATVPKWVKVLSVADMGSSIRVVYDQVDNLLSVASVHFSNEFHSTLADCWVTREKKSLYASPEEVQILIKQVLSWDIRSMSQRKRPHNANRGTGSNLDDDLTSDLEDDKEEKPSNHETQEESFTSPSDVVTYHLMLEGLDISYGIDSDGNVVVEKATLPWEVESNTQNRCNYTVWKDILG